MTRTEEDADRGGDDVGSFARLLRTERARAGLTQADLADRTELSSRTIRYLEAGVVGHPRPDTVTRLIRALSCRSEVAAQMRATTATDSTPVTELADARVGLAAAGSGTSALPRPPTGFVGRQTDLAALDDLCLTDRPPAPVVITGMAGVGKTALALTWAHRHAERFPGGQVLLDLQGFTPGREPLTPAEALPRLLAQLDADMADCGGSFEEQLARWRNRHARLPALVLLDNVRSSAQADPLLPGAGSSIALITSRMVLDGLLVAPGARLHRLETLEAETARQVLIEMVGVKRVAEQGAATDDLVSLCGGLPLALRVAGARLAAAPRLPVAAVTDELRRSERLTGLSTQDEEVSVDAVFEASYLALPLALRRTFPLLSVHPGQPYSAASVAALCGVPPIIAEVRLRSLAARHLLEDAGSDDYRMHDLLDGYLRRVADREVSAGERAAAWTRLFRHYVAGAGAADRATHSRRRHFATVDDGPTTPRFADAATAHRWLSQESANLLALAREAVNRSGGQMAWQLPHMLHDHVQRSAAWRDWLPLFETAVAAHPTPDELGLALANDLGIGYAEQRRFTDALRQFEHVLEHCDPDADALNYGRFLTNIGCVRQEIGDLAGAESRFLEAIPVRRRAGDRTGEANTLVNLAENYRRRGDPRQARDSARRALELSASLGHAALQLKLATVLGGLHADLGEFDDADRVLRDALTQAQTLGERRHQAEICHRLGELWESRDGALATAFVDEARATYREMGWAVPEALRDHLLGQTTAAGRPPPRRRPSRRP